MNRRTNVLLTDEDQEIIARLRKQSGGTATSVIREAIRALDRQAPESSPAGRPYMTHHHLPYGAYTIGTMSGTEPGYEGAVLLVSVAGPGLPRVRVMEAGLKPLSGDDVQMDDGQGVIVFGSHIGDRPYLKPPETR